MTEKEILLLKHVMKLSEKEASPTVDMEEMTERELLLLKYVMTLSEEESPTVEVTTTEELVDMDNKIEVEKDYLPLLKYLMILNEKGVPATTDSVTGMIYIGAIDVKNVDGKWYVAKAEMVKRIKERGKKWPAVEAGYYSIHGFIYHLSERGIDLDEGNISNLMFTGRLEYKQDDYSRYIIPAHELEKQAKVKRVSIFG